MKNETIKKFGIMVIVLMFCMNLGVHILPSNVFSSSNSISAAEPVGEGTLKGEACEDGKCKFYCLDGSSVCNAWPCSNHDGPCEIDD